MPIGVGSSFLHYTITGALGAGGMGEVYRASDSRLGRDVAIKALPAKFSGDAERLARFDREARALAGLNHPNIAAIYGIEDFGGERYLVMELVDGETLAERIQRGPVAIDETIDIAKQIADGLAAAHERGIIHRDLKPANIKITPEGRVKILDFGLAKAIESTSNTDLTSSPTEARATMSGVLLGTAGYMSPEQARGQQVDRRADVWAFGVVVWEMLTGASLFRGDTVSDTLAAVLREEPRWSDLPDVTPAALRRVLRRALARRAADRMRDFGDIRLELAEDDEAPKTHVTETARRSSIAWVVAALAIIAATATSFLLWRKPAAAAIPLRKSVLVNDWAPPQWGTAAISPDGSRIAYFNQGSLWIRDLDALMPRKVDAPATRSPIAFWSPDGKWLAYMLDEKLCRIPAAGTTSTVIATVGAANTSGDLRVLAGAWGADDRIVLALWRGGLVEVSARGGTAVELIAASKDLVDFHYLEFLPGGKDLLAVPHRLDNQVTAEVIRGKRRETILRLDEGALATVAWSPTGHLVFERSGTSSGIWAVPFDLRAMKATGRPFIVAPGGGSCSASRDGSLVYVSDIDDRPGRIVRFDRTGTIVRSFGDPPDDVQSPLLSPDGRTLAFASRESDHRAYLWLADAERGTRHRLSGGEAGEMPTDWSPNGHQLLVARERTGNWNDPASGTWLYAIDGSAPPKKISGGWFASFTPDGRSAVLSTLGLRADANVAVVPLDASTPLAEFIRSPTNKFGPVVSPDGNRVAYTEVGGGERNVVVARFPSGDERRIVGAGVSPHWSADGRLLYFANGSALTEAPFNAATGEWGAPAAVLDTTALNVTLSQVLRDGTFLGVQRLPSTRRHLILVQNWFAEFREQAD